METLRSSRSLFGLGFFFFCECIFHLLSKVRAVFIRQDAQTLTCNGDTTLRVRDTILVHLGDHKQQLVVVILINRAKATASNEDEISLFQSETIVPFRLYLSELTDNVVYHSSPSLSDSSSGSFLLACSPFRSLSSLLPLNSRLPLIKGSKLDKLLNGEQASKNEPEE